jgi:hypothetical protein
MRSFVNNAPKTIVKLDVVDGIFSFVVQIPLQNLYLCTRMLRNAHLRPFHTTLIYEMSNMTLLSCSSFMCYLVNLGSALFL